MSVYKVIPILITLFMAFNKWLTTCTIREREMFYLTTHSTHFIHGYMASDMVKDHSDSEREREREREKCFI